MPGGGAGAGCGTGDVPDLLRLTRQADEDGLDLFSLPVLEHRGSGFILFSPGGTPDPATLAVWAQEIAPAVRAAISAAD